MTDCWIWPFRLLNSGYGHYWNKIDKKYETAHRSSYEYFKGTIPKGLHILHSCDVKACFNPHHLEANTRSKNVKDAIERGLHPKLLENAKKARLAAAISKKAIPHCIRGHENYVTYGGKRYCRTCRQRSQHEIYKELSPKKQEHYKRYGVDD